jgi:hypothetical protein
MPTQDWYPNFTKISISIKKKTNNPAGKHTKASTGNSQKRNIQVTIR